jgi:DNA polymerase-3 subunit epsilon
MKTIAIIDLEGTDKRPQFASIVEIGCCLWSVEHRTRIESYTTLVRAEDNPAAHVNRIPPSALVDAPELPTAFSCFDNLIERADAIVAHHGDGYDKPLLERLGCEWASRRPWIDSMEIAWPVESSSRSLLAVAHAHGVQIGTLHRAGDDVALVASLLERVAEMGYDVGELLAKAMRPKLRFVADVPRERNDELKAARFRWDPDRREWWRRMTAEDAAALGFPVREVA